jgi:dTDP-4-amino-4,6-dideoxygalactose transaminase
MGYNFRMSAMQSALGLAQLERLDYLVAARRIIAHQYEQVIREEDCRWLIPPVVPEGSTHSYWCYTCKLDEELLGVDWRRFRRTFIEHGGDGLYGLWVPVHLEPVFRDLSFYGAPERSPHHDPRYRGTVRAYRAGDCPAAERLRRSACLFSARMLSMIRFFVMATSQPTRVPLAGSNLCRFLQALMKTSCVTSLARASSRLRRQ